MNTNDQTTTNFDDALKELCDAITQNYRDQAKEPGMSLTFSETGEKGCYWQPVKVEIGPKNVRIVKIESHGGKSVVCFVDKATGNILKAAGWKAPAKGARGNIYTKDYVGKITPHGAWLYLR